MIGRLLYAMILTKNVNINQCFTFMLKYLCLLQICIFGVSIVALFLAEFCKHAKLSTKTKAHGYVDYFDVSYDFYLFDNDQ